MGRSGKEPSWKYRGPEKESSVAATQRARAEDEIQGPGRGRMAMASQAMLKTLDLISLAMRPLEGFI